MEKTALDAILQLRHELHHHPELSLQEKWTKKHLMEFIQGHTDFEVVDRGAWFYAVKYAEKSADSPIAFRADFDALPIREASGVPYASACDGKSHACGHDGHSAALCGLAMELSHKPLQRDVYLIFQYGEEIGAGGKVCAQLIPEKGISEVYAFHNLSGYPQGAIVIREGLTQPASKGLTIRLEGRTSHASDPEQGNNPSLAIAELVVALHDLLRQPHEGMVLGTVVNIEVGTKDFGVSAGSGELSMTLRAEQEKELEKLEQALRDKAAEFSKEYGLKASFTISDPFPETRNNHECLEKVRRAAASLGNTVIEMQDLWRASEDFGCYTKQCPGAIFYLGNGEDYAPLHTSRYDFNDRNVSRAVDMFLEILKKPALPNQ
jgi:amidohydrolase